MFNEKNIPKLISSVPPIGIILATVIFILWLARYNLEEVDAKEFRIYSTVSIGGLSKNSIVEYKGLNIGLIEKIQINPRNIEQIEIILKITREEIEEKGSIYVILQEKFGI